jgi:SHAQKYF class myb-like DNA-binding protein
MDGIEKSRRKSYVVRRKEYWTEEEHERFLAGLEQFGRNWRAIERIVRTKTAVQVRSHAQRYFIREAKRKEQDPSTSQTAGSDGPLSDRSYGLNETTSQDSNYSRPQNTANVGIPSYEEQGRYSDPGKTRREIPQGNPSTWAPWGSGYDQQAEQGFANLHPHQAPASGQNSTSKYIELSYINFWMECQHDRFLEKSFENVVPSPPTTPQEQQRTYPAVSKDTRAPSISPSESRYYSQYRYPPFVPYNNIRTYRNTPPPPPPPPLNYQPPPWLCVERRRDAQVSTKEENSLPSFSELVASCGVELRPSTSQLNVSVPCPQGSSFFSQAQSRPLSMTSEGFHGLGSCNRNVSTLGSCTYLPCQGRYGEVFKYSSFGNQQYTDWNKMMGIM